MARVFPPDSEEWEIRGGLSEFQNVVHDVARPRARSRNKGSRPTDTKYRLRLAELLLSDYVLTPEDRATLADYFRGSLQRKRGHPKGKREVVRLDWLAAGARKYSQKRAELREAIGNKIKVRDEDGALVRVRLKLCRDIATELGRPDKAEMLESYIKRAQSRR